MTYTVEISAAANRQGAEGAALSLVPILWGGIGAGGERRTGRFKPV